MLTNVFLQNQSSNFNQAWHRTSLAWLKGNLNEVAHSFFRGDHKKIVKIHLPSLKIFSRTIGSISSKLSSKTMNGTQGFTIKDHLILGKRDNVFFSPTQCYDI